MAASAAPLTWAGRPADGCALLVGPRLCNARARRIIIIRRRRRSSGSSSPTPNWPRPLSLCLSWLLAAGLAAAECLALASSLACGHLHGLKQPSRRRRRRPSSLNSFALLAATKVAAASRGQQRQRCCAGERAACAKTPNWPLARSLALPPARLPVARVAPALVKVGSFVEAARRNETQARGSRGAAAVASLV